ncbi:MAG: cysteine desulfurase family protein [Acidimicrobiia bacterium]
MYLDHAATTTIRPEAVAALMHGFEVANANASGTHAAARAAKNALEEARERASDLLGADRPDEIVFTSGGTESDNLAVVGASLASERHTVVVSEIEHKAVTESAAYLKSLGRAWSMVGCDSAGVVGPGAVANAVDDSVAVVSVMAANNEVGTLQPIAQIAEAARSRSEDVVVHTDAVQAFVGGDVTVESTGVDLLSLAAHKFGGPKGVGLLYVRSGVELDPIVFGGGQEAGRRSGTSNVPGVLGMVAAMEAAIDQRERFSKQVGFERDAFEQRVVAACPHASVTSQSASRMPHFSHLRFAGVSAETLLIRLDQQGIQAAAGSACQSGAVTPSHVLVAMGMTDQEASECVRFSFGWDTAEGDGTTAADAVIEVVEALR